MNDAEKIKILANALNEANILIFDNRGWILSNDKYFKLRNLIVDALNKAEQKVI